MKGKVAMMTGPRSLVFEEYDLPEVEAGAILARVVRTNVCGSELHIWEGHHPFKKSGVLGHEMVGVVETIGQEVKTDYAGNPIKIGDRITSAYFITCRKCVYCQKNQMHLCENAFKFWSKMPEEAPHFHGTFGTHYYIHPDQFFYKVPDNVPDSVAASANCALSQVYFGIEKANLRYGESVVIQGAGGLGLNAAVVAKEFGATVIVIDGLSSRLEKAKTFGADYVIDMNVFDTVEKRSNAVLELTDGKGANIGLELTGVPAAFSEGIHLLRKGGRYVSIGNVSPGLTTPFDPGLLTRKSIQIIPVMQYDPWYLQKALQFLSKNNEKYPFSELLDKHFDLEEIETALDESIKRNVTRASIVVTNVSKSIVN
ncbi:zinc-binding dehydrogenase [bacterium LRH843]|nr:zinc-binding dehydrogenase [bacterium LRH843]